MSNIHSQVNKKINAMKQKDSTLTYQTKNFSGFLGMGKKNVIYALFQKAQELEFHPTVSEQYYDCKM